MTGWLRERFGMVFHFPAPGKGNVLVLFREGKAGPAFLFAWFCILLLWYDYAKNN